jgi:hypothetical protein
VPERDALAILAPQNRAYVLMFLERSNELHALYCHYRVRRCIVTRLETFLVHSDFCSARQGSMPPKMDEFENVWARGARARK